MKTAAIIAEYNPFHNGHRYQIEQTRKLTGADTIIVLMSGNFIQRGGPAVIEKYSRTKMALESGADVVFELPVCFATSSAPFFAKGAVMLLDLCGCIDFLCFGSESGNLSLFYSLSDLLLNESKNFQSCLKQELRSGKTFPAAREKSILEALHFCEGNDINLEYSSVSEFLSSPNNILGLEYVKALRERNSTITPITILRKGSGYHSKELKEKYCSATGFRSFYESFAQTKQILSFDRLNEHFKDLLPETSLKILFDAFGKTAPICEQDFASILQYLCLTSSKEHLSSIFEIGSELADRIHNQSVFPCSFDDLVVRLKTRQITRTRILRGLFHLLLGLRKEDMNSYLQDNGYLRLLGFRSSATVFLKHLKTSASIPVLTKPAAAKRLLSSVSFRMFELDLLAARLYHQIVYTCYGIVLSDEYKQSPIIVKT